MSTEYDDAVLVDLPAVYPDLDLGGPATNGQTVEDASGNGLDGTLTYTATGGEQAWGFPSPIETQPDAFDFRGWTNAGVASLTGVSRIAVADDDLLHAPGDFSCEAWLRAMDNIPLAGDFALVQKQGTGGIGLTFDGGTRFFGYCIDTDETVWEVHDTSFLVTDFLGTSFHVVVVRLADALALYVNGSLRGTTTITSSLPTQVTGDPFRVHPDTPFFLHARYAKPAFYTHALSGARAQAHFDAAVPYTDVSGEAHVRVTASINESDEPEPYGAPLRHNWEKEALERFSWRTSAFKPSKGASELARQRSAPRRQIEYSHLLYSDSVRRRFEARAWGNDRKTICQFEPDKVQVGGAGLPAGSTSFAFDTTLKDFEEGHRVLFYQDEETYEYKTLTEVTDLGIEWDEELVNSYTATAFVKPARLARLPTNQAARILTDIYGDASSVYDLLPEDEPLTPRRLTPWAPTLSYRSEEAFDLAEWQEHDYSEPIDIEFVADFSELDLDAGTMHRKRFDSARLTSSYRMLLDGRAVIAKYLGWLYYRGGMQVPFWMPNFRNDLQAVSRTGFTVTVAGHEYSDIYTGEERRRDVAFVYFDNSMVLRRTNSVAVSGANDVLTLDASAPTLTGLRWLCFLRRVTLADDLIEIAWHTDSVVRAAFAVTDL